MYRLVHTNSNPVNVAAQATTSSNQVNLNSTVKPDELSNVIKNTTFIYDNQIIPTHKIMAISK